MNKTKRILIAERIERAMNDKLAKSEAKTQCRECGHSQMVKIAPGESKRVTCKCCRTSYGLTAH